MKKYINTDGEEKYFVGSVPNGWRELTPEEIENNKLAEEQRAYVKSELFKIYDAQDEYLKLQFEPVRAGLEAAFDANDLNKTMAIFTSPYLPDAIKPIAQEIYSKYLELTGG